MNGDIESMSWESVNGWAPMGGALEAVARKIREHKIQGILLVGGFEAFHSVLQMADQRDKYPEFKIPMVVLPATIR
jgi:6-phosphofructokinase 1